MAAMPKENDMSVIDEKLIRQRLMNHSLEELWDIADTRFTFTADAPGDMVRSHHIHRRIAAELTGYDEFYAKRAHQLPENPGEITGQDGTPLVDWVRVHYPGVAAYFRWAQVSPSHFTLSQVSRFGLWVHFERALITAHQAQKPIEDWLEFDRDMLAAAVREHIAARRAGGVTLPV